MSIVKSFSVGNGDMYYIKHESDNFSVIDCCIDDENKEAIVDEIIEESKSKGIHRFISTHPDEDHILGLADLNKSWEIINFYCVDNEANKDDRSESFEMYCELRDDKEKAFHIYKGCSRRWMNISSRENDEIQRGGAGIHILWPDVDNEDYQDVLEKVKGGESPNNLSPIFIYRCGVNFMWMGDIETGFLEKVQEDIEFEEVDVLFAPHHGRESGKIPEEILKIINPQVIVIGEAPSKNLNYYDGYNTLTQNSAGDIIFDINNESVDIYVGNDNYAVSFLDYRNKNKFRNYIGSFDKRVSE